MKITYNIRKFPNQSGCQMCVPREFPVGSGRAGSAELSNYSVIFKSISTEANI